MQLTPSEHEIAAPEQTPLAQTSPLVQGLPSLHAAALFVWKQPLCGLHPSSVHGSESPQERVDGPTQEPAVHVSPVVQALPSEHGPEIDGPGWQAPFAQASLPVQGFPSSQAPVAFV